MTVRDLSPTQRRRDATLSFTGVNPNTRQLSWGATSKPTPARRLCPWATPEKRRWVPEPTLCVEASPTISSRYLLTSRTSSGSFPPSEVTFHIPRASLSIRGSGHRGLHLRPPPKHPGIGPPRSPPSSAAQSSLHRSLTVPPAGGLGLARLGPARSNPANQVLSDESRSQAWLQGGTPTPSYRATSRASSHVPQVVMRGF
ncbi:hypothetical protein AMECASPLE_007694 [Ameca splendens]|uniref:Uncharacterized protein n=1 Tax=Ameca splendens TaxID=208324 RepID=A0ABV0ZAB6_9TELE